MDQYWKILGVRPSSQSEEELKKTFRRLALKHHPDKGGNEEHFKQITEAYEILTGKRKVRRRPPPPRPPVTRPIPKPPKPKIRKVDHDICAFCRGTGRYDEQLCHYCYGVGRVVRQQYSRAVSRPRPPKKKVEYTYDSYDICHICGGLGKWKPHCEVCLGTGNVVGGDEQNSTIVRECTNCKIMTCKECEGRGRIYLGKRKGYRWV